MRIQFQQMRGSDFITDPRGLISVPVPVSDDYQTVFDLKLNRDQLEEATVSEFKESIEYMDELDLQTYILIRYGAVDDLIQEEARHAITELISHAATLEPSEWVWDEVNFYFSIEE
ncbi:hypothetical protein ACQ4M3_09860 [Leptolyngbya sp. AN03gr2]|uniref:hypothetical protein n=1 Tax=Leptolyngbya sp. AN03gr2 TaxID=3423364 RepID=UPI003D322EC0